VTNPLFQKPKIQAPSPLAERMRPRSLDEVVGQGEVLREGGFMRTALAQDALVSMIFWGPPGCGKTTLARLVARSTKAHFEPFSAVLGGVKEVRKIVEAARQRLGLSGRRTVLFVDEIHRFNKSQQDAFLPHVEDGTLTLIGATTENPSFALNSALLSRCRVVRLEAHAPEDLAVLLERALADEERGLGTLKVTAGEGVLVALARAADGDARRALSHLEQVATHASRTNRELDLELAQETLGASTLRHDRAGDAHYDVVSAFIKSLRGSDPDAALYYMARLLEGGDDPRFICRRLVIFASEDIGNADPRALSVAVDAMQAFQMIGMPEGRIVLGQACTYLATAPKSNASYKAIDAAIAAVRDTGTLQVPNKLKNAPTALMKEQGNSEGYKYPHDWPGGVVPNEQYLPRELRGARFYEPKPNGYERHIADRLRHWRGEGES